MATIHEIAPDVRVEFGRSRQAPLGRLEPFRVRRMRRAQSLTPDDVLTTGNYRFRFYPSPHIPHGWDAGVLFEETRRTLFCSDLFHHFGNVEPVTQADLVGRTRDALKQMQQGPLSGYMPYTSKTEGVLRGLAELKPAALAVMHGSSFVGPCDRLLNDLAGVIKEAFENG